MASVWYVGSADVRAIDSTEWTRISAPGATKTWDNTNGWSIDQTAFTSPQLTILGALDEFVLTSSNGPRPGSVVTAAPNQDLTLSDVTELVNSLAHTGRDVWVAGVGNGTTDDRGAFATADTTAIVNGATLVLGPGTYKVASNLTVTSPIEIRPGAVIKPDSGVTVTLSGGVSAPRRQIFDHSVGGLVVPKKVDYYHPTWWGPVGTSNDTATWTAMAAALAASVVTDNSINYGQRILAPAGINRFFGVSLASCHLVADKGTCLFYPSGTPTSGSMLTLNDYVTVSGGFWRTNGTSQAITILDLQGQRSQIENVYIVPDATGAVGINCGSGTTRTPVLHNIRINTGTTSRRGTGIVMNSADAEMSNIWIGQCDVGLNSLVGVSHISNLHIWGCNTGWTGNPDMCKVHGMFIDSNVGWGIDWVSADRNLVTSAYIWNNGAGVGSTGGMRILKSGAPSCRDNILSGCAFDDNTGVGLLIDGAIGTELNGVRFGSQTVQGGGSAITDTGVRVTSTAVSTRLNIRGRKADHITALVDDQSTSTSVDLGSVKKSLAADVAYTSTTTFTTLLSLPIEPGERWLLEGVLYVDGGQTGDFKVRLQTTSATGATGMIAIPNAPAASTTSTTAGSINPSNAAASALSAGTGVTVGTIGAGVPQALALDGHVLVAAVAGTLELQGAQNTSDAVATTVRAGSWLRATRDR